MKQLLLLLLMCQPIMTAAKSAKIWPTIPFIRGADLCERADRRTRMEYMHEMTSMASELMSNGAKGSEALDLLVTFDAIHDKNLELSKKDKTIEVTLENTLKGYLDGYYRDLGVAKKNIEFRHINSIRRIIQDAGNGQRTGYLPEDTFNYLDYVAYGSFSEARGCRGRVVVTLTLVDREGITNTYEATGNAGTVMSIIASRMFEDFQRTTFPTTLDLGNKRIKLLGTPKGSVSTSNDPRTAQRACQMIGGRLPNDIELEMISSFGDWNGGVSINKAVWAISQYGNPKVYHPGLMNPSPVRDMRSVNTRVFKYYCVK